MVSGAVTSPKEFSKIDSGEAKLTIILEKSLVLFVFLDIIIQIIISLLFLMLGLLIREPVR